MTATLWRSEIGTVAIAPGTLLLFTTDNLASVTAAGYLNLLSAASGVQVRPTDFVFVNYSGGNDLFTLTVSAGVYTLVPLSGSISGGESLGGDAIYAGVSGTDLTFKGLVAGTNITLTPAADTITITASGGSGGLSWASISGTTQAAAINTGYINTNSGLTTITLPSTAVAGSVVRVQGLGAGGWTLQAGASQFITVGNTSTSMGGSVSSSNRYDTLEVVCIEANTLWSAGFGVSLDYTII